MRFLGNRRALSIRFQVLFVCILSLVIMQLLLMVNYYRFKEMKVEANSKYFSDLITQMADSVELNCSYLNGMVENIAYSRVVQDYLMTDDKAYLRVHNSDVKNFIIPFADINNGIKDIAVIGTYGNYVNLNADIYDLRKIIDLIPEKTLWYYTGLNDVKIINPYKKDKYFTVGTNVYSASDLTRKEKIGTVLITFKVRSIFGFAQNRQNNKLPDMLIYDRNNQLAYSGVEKGIATSYEEYFDKEGNEKSDVIRQGKKTFYIKTGKLESLGGKVVFLIPKEELMAGLESSRVQTMVICFFTFLLMLSLSIIVTNNIVVPIRQFMDYLNKVGKGDLRMIKQPVRLKGAAEIIVMSDTFNRMMEEMNDLNHRLVNTSARLYESELAKRQAELEYMYSQINPHFLFNTLETIKGCAVDESAENTFQMINSLGRMFRYCVRFGNIVPLEEEINVINSYMLLQKKRFGDKLNYICNIKADIYEVSIPKMILQPLIENAVIHGIEENDAITVWLEGELLDEVLYFYVRDDGTGVDEERRKELLRMMNDNTKTSHIGISNVNKRLKYIYGEEYGINIEGTDGHGFCVSVRFPYQKIIRHQQFDE